MRSRTKDLVWLVRERGRKKAKTLQVYTGFRLHPRGAQGAYDVKDGEDSIPPPKSLGFK